MVPRAARSESARHSNDDRLLPLEGIVRLVLSRKTTGHDGVAHVVRVGDLDEGRVWDRLADERRRRHGGCVCTKRAPMWMQVLE